MISERLLSSFFVHSVPSVDLLPSWEAEAAAEACSFLFFFFFFFWKGEKEEDEKEEEAARREGGGGRAITEIEGAISLLRFDRK